MKLIHNKKALEAYECLVEIALYNRSFDDIRVYTSDKIMAYGTALHEKMFNVSSLISMFEQQRKELQNTKVNIQRSLVLNHSFAQGNAYFVVEEFVFNMEDVSFDMRLSTVLELVENKWEIVHFHASTPDANIPESSTLPFEELQIKNITLEAKVKERTVELNKSLTNLKATQTQLIQSEKMASLGELTAGIAHEIQNPLNFVNNFSEISTEMVDEMNEEIDGGNFEEVKNIAKDLKQNLNIITNHGKRASSIVKGMLDHSRTGSGISELTDINKLADEYLRLSYHGLRAKDKSFNADFKTDFDTSLPKIKVVSQDLGRVILNLINNAFYVVSEKEKAPQPPKGRAKYKPKVTVSTKAYKSPSGDLGIEIRVKDNGSGIPDNIKDKIFQPFFTTKPTGSGTGLGLSLAYDIITKGHGGELMVESKEGEGSEFIIVLPIKK